MFKKTAVILFLLSHVLASSHQKSKSNSNSKLKASRPAKHAPSAFSMTTRSRKPKTSSPLRVSPVDITLLNLSSSGSVKSVSIEESAPPQSNISLDELDSSDFVFFADFEDEITSPRSFEGQNLPSTPSSSSSSSSLAASVYSSSTTTTSAISTSSSTSSSSTSSSSSAVSSFASPAPGIASYINDSLLAAIKIGDLDAIQRVISYDVEMINCLSMSTGTTPFMQAIMSGNRKVVDFFLETGMVDPNVFVTEGQNVILLAAKYLDMSYVRRILNVPIKFQPLYAMRAIYRILQSESENPQTTEIIRTMIETRQPVIISFFVASGEYAVCTDNLALLRFLHTNGIPLNQMYEGMSLIHYAAARGNVEILEFLLGIDGSSIDTLTETDEKLSALSVAFLKGHLNVVIYLIEHGASAGLDHIIMFAIRESHFPILEAFLSIIPFLGENILANGYNLLTWAVMVDNVRSIRMILDSRKINPLIPDAAGRTIYNMELPENASEDLKDFIMFERMEMLDFL